MGSDLAERGCALVPLPGWLSYHLQPTWPTPTSRRFRKPIVKIVRFQNPQGEIQFGNQRHDCTVTLLSGHPLTKLVDTHRPAEVIKLLAPIEPRDIICIGLNYRKHAVEGNQPIPERPVVFMKNSGALQNPGDPIILPRRLASDSVDYECELAVILGKECYNVSKADAMSYVLGYTCANDVSARDWQMKYGGTQWCRGKTFATFCPLGPCLVTTEEIVNPNNLSIRTVLNGQTMQDWNTNDMIFDIPTLIEFLSGSTRLAAGTVILTGTPHGVGGARKPPVFLQPGDSVTIEIEGIGSLNNPVVAES
jgi:2-keto-4-pentenoate hydratase/2-oxohepta-3-ene-1,7-dioic acid hydratase in catechol pathway